MTDHHYCDNPGCPVCAPVFNRSPEEARAARQAHELLLAAPRAVQEALDNLHAKKEPVRISIELSFDVFDGNDLEAHYREECAARRAEPSLDITGALIDLICWAVGDWRGVCLRTSGGYREVA